MIFLLLYSYNEKEWRGRMIIMHMTSIGKKTWCQRVRAAIILEGAILLVAAFILFFESRQACYIYFDSGYGRIYQWDCVDDYFDADS